MGAGIAQMSYHFNMSKYESPGNPNTDPSHFQIRQSKAGIFQDIPGDKSTLMKDSSCLILASRRGTGKASMPTAEVARWWRSGGVEECSSWA